MAKSNKTPEQKKRAAIRLEIRKLLLKRSEVLNEIDNLIESLDPKLIAQDKIAEKSEVDSKIKWLDDAEDGELDQSDWEHIWSPIIGKPVALTEDDYRQPFWKRKSSHFWQQSCIWYGVKVLSFVYPVQGSFGFSTKKRPFYYKYTTKPVQFNGPCENNRLPLDFYCDLHREDANESIRNGYVSEKFINFQEVQLQKGFYDRYCAGVNISPIPKPKSYLIRRRILAEIESERGSVAQEVSGRRAELAESKKVLKQIDNDLTYYQNSLANLESHLKRRRLPENTRLSIYRKYDFKCAICRIDLTLITPHIDHIKPLAKGGKDVLSNLQPLCEPCNLKKGAKYEEEDN